MPIRLGRLLLHPRTVLAAVLTSAACSVVYLNVTGFCYSQRRYVPDDEILVKVLNLDWKTNMERVVRRNPSLRSGGLAQLVTKVPTWGRVGGRSMHYGSLLYDDPLMDMPREIFRVVGVYAVVASLAFDSGVGRDRYLMWFRSFDRCGEPNHSTFTDDNDKVEDDRWNGPWHRVHTDGDKVGFGENQQAGQERR